MQGLAFATWAEVTALDDVRDQRAIAAPGFRRAFERRGRAVGADAALAAELERMFDVAHHLVRDRLRIQAQMRPEDDPGQVAGVAARVGHSAARPAACR